MRLNVGCGTHYHDGWINTDLKATDTTTPDILVTLDDPFPFPDGSVDQLYMGHVLEHVVWEQLPDFLAGVMRVMKPGAPLMATGPDIYRVLEQWRNGAESWDLVVGALEHAELPGHTDWPNAHHQWNMNEERVHRVLEAAGFTGLTATRTPPEGWPVVNWSRWQCCVYGRKPEC